MGVAPLRTETLSKRYGRLLDEPTSGLDPLMERRFRRAVAAARANGQTVFLSSHQLAEVEAVCDRVGILRAGKLVEVASVAALRRLHRAEVTATFTGTPPDLNGIVGVDRLHHDGPATVRFTLNDSPAAALRAMADAEVATIAVREPSLEEIFLAYYGQAYYGQDAR